MRAYRRKPLTAVLLLMLTMVASPAAAQGQAGASRLNLSVDVRFSTEVRVTPFKMPSPWDDLRAVRLPRYPLMADPRRWPRLFANTTECTLSLNPITRRHWWQG